MSCRRAHCLMFLLLLALVGSLATVSRSQQPTLPDPLPLRRVVIPVDRVANELKRQGTLVPMSRADFETKVRQAAQSLEAAQKQPRLIKSYYAAELAGQALTNGSGQWTVDHPGAAPGILPVNSFNLALGKIKLGSLDAVFGDLDGKNLGLWVEKQGMQDVYFDWSARGQAQAGGLAFELRLPPCALTILELKLAADQTLALGKNAGIVVGPLETERPALKLWRIQVTGQSVVDFVVRKNSASATRLVLTTIESRQELATGGIVHADFDVNVEPVQQPLTELIFDHDPALQPYEVTLRQAELKNWDLLPPTGDANGKLAAVVVRLREAKQGAFQVKVRCLATRPGVPDWTSPRLFMRHALPRGETLHLVVAGAQPLESWDPGQFRLIHTSADKDGAQTLRLVDLQPEAALPRRPRLTLQKLATQVHVRQQTRWTLTPAGMTLDTEFACTARGEPRFQLSVQLPLGSWRVDELAWEPKERLRAWSVAGNVVNVELQRPLETRAPGKLTLRLSAPLDQAPSAQRLLTIPEPVPLAIAQRQATYAIHIDPALQAVLVRSSSAPSLPDVTIFSQESFPWFTFAYRDQPLTGLLRVQGPRTAVGVRVQQAATLAFPEAALETRIEIEPTLGQPTHLDLQISAPVKGPWSVIREQGAPPFRLERRTGPEALAPLLLLGARHGIEKALTLANLPGGQSWRLSWPEPVNKRTLVLLRAALAPALGDAGLPEVAGGVGQGWRRWDIPIVTVVGAEQNQGELVLQDSAAPLTHSMWRGVQPLDAVAGAPARVYRWSDVVAAPALTVWTKPAAATDAPPLFDHAQLISFVDADGKCLHLYRFQALRWRRVELPLLLPEPARQVLAIRLDGRWMDRAAHQQVAEGIEVRLPMPLDGQEHWFEVLFESDRAAGGPFARATTAPHPKLPAAPMRARQSWRLAAGWAPLHQEYFASLHRGLGAPVAWLKTVWNGADALVDAVIPSDADDWLKLQKRMFLDAEDAARKMGSRDRTLAEALQRLLFDGLKEQKAVVLDRAALRAAALRPETGISLGQATSSQPFWESLGLVYVPTKVAPLLTTRQRWLDWQKGRALPAPLAEALAQAVAQGQDATGAFCRADVWLRSESNRQFEGDAGPAPLADWIAHGWTEWEPLPGPSDGSVITILDVAALRVAGLLAGSLTLVLVGLVRRRLALSHRLRLAILLLVVDLGLLMSTPVVLADLAFWPAVALLLLLALDIPRYLASVRAQARRSQSTARRRQPLVGSAALLLVLSGGGWFAWAQPDGGDPFTVYFTESGPARALALVRPELLKRLDELRERAVQPAQGAILVGANYQSKGLSVGDVQAQFDLYSFSDQTTLHVPLDGVELQEGAFLDGAPVFPTSAAKVGFLVPIRGKGWHHLTLGFSMRSQAAGDFHELKCKIPALARCTVEWQAPTMLGNLQLVRASGETKSMIDSAQKIQELRGYLGRESQLHLRWRVVAVPAAAELKIREHYFWDLDARAPSLAALLAITPAQGHLTRIEWALPEMTEVRGVEATSSGQILALTKWRVLDSGGPRRLSVELTAPAPGPFQLHVQLVPRGGFLGASASLRLPPPLQTKLAEGTLAYRLEGLEITDKTNNLSVTGLTPEAFVNLWQKSGGRDLGAPTRAYNFRHDAAASLELNLQPAKTQVRLEADWQVAPTGADLHLQAAWTSPRDLFAVELQLPVGLKVQEVQSPNMHHWIIQDRSLHVWLEKPSRQVAITVLGVAAQPLKNQRFLLPTLQAPQTQATTTIVVRPSPGWKLIAERMVQLTRSADGQDLRYQTTQTTYEGMFHLQPMAAVPVFHALTSVEPRGDHLATTVSLFGYCPGDFPSFQVRLRRWPGQAPRFDISPSPSRKEHQQAGGDHVFTVQLPPGKARLVSIAIRGRIDAGQAFVVPRVEIEGGQLVEQQVTWPTEALAVQEMRGLKETKTIAPGTRHGLLAALAARRPGKLWLAEQSDWHCELAAIAPMRAKPGQVLFAEQQAVPAGSGRWLHQADWLILARDLRDLRVQLPKDAEPVLTMIDGRIAMPRLGTTAVLEVPTPVRVGLMHVRILWRYADGREGGKRLLLAAPSLPDVEPAIVQGAVYLPPGQVVRERPDGFVNWEGPRLTALARACIEATLALNKKEGSDGDPAALAAWRQQFQQVNRHLEYQARLRSETDAQDVVVKLRKEYQAAFAGAVVPKGLEKGEPGWVVAGSDVGAPLFWIGTPPAWLRLDASADNFAAWWSRETLVLIVVGVFLLSWLPYGILWFARLWPEQVAGLAVLGWALWGTSVVALALVALAAVGRTLSLIGWLHAVTTTAGPVPPSGPSTATPVRS